MAPRKAQNAAPSTTTSTRMTRARSKAACAQPVQIGGSFLSREADEDFKELLPPKKKRNTTHSSAAPETSGSTTHSAISNATAIVEDMELDDSAQISDETATTSTRRLTKTKKRPKAVLNIDSSNVLRASCNSYYKGQHDRRCPLETVPLDILHEVHHLLTTYHFDPAEWLSACADIRLP